jgi:DNA (cytosine-5)-methyltransferase 1
MTARSQLVLSLFPGIGMLDMAFEEEGFCIVRGPDLLWGGDIRRFHPPAGKFDGVIGGPPCQAFSRLRHIVEANGYQVAPNLIPEFERVVRETAPIWFVMENVPAAPKPAVDEYRIVQSMVSDVSVGGITSRLRRFTWGIREGHVTWKAQQFSVQDLALWNPEPEHAALAHGGGRPVPVALIRDKNGGHRSKKSAFKNYGYNTRTALVEHRRKQGLPDNFLDDAPFTVSGKIEAIGNGVPLPMGRAVAKAVKRALGL